MVSETKRFFGRHPSHALPLFSNDPSPHLSLIRILILGTSPRAPRSASCAAMRAPATGWRWWAGLPASARPAAPGRGVALPPLPRRSSSLSRPARRSCTPGCWARCGGSREWVGALRSGRARTHNLAVAQLPPTIKTKIKTCTGTTDRPGLCARNRRLPGRLALWPPPSRRRRLRQRLAVGGRVRAPAAGVGAALPGDGRACVGWDGHPPAHGRRRRRRVGLGRGRPGRRGSGGGRGRAVPAGGLGGAHAPCLRPVVRGRRGGRPGRVRLGRPGRLLLRGRRGRPPPHRPPAVPPDRPGHRAGRARGVRGRGGRRDL